jgi:hypothetical protein
MGVERVEKNLNHQCEATGRRLKDLEKAVTKLNDLLFTVRVTKPEPLLSVEDSVTRVSPRSGCR